MASRTVHITVLALSCMIVHSFLSEVEALQHCDREKGCDHVFGGSFFERIGEGGFGGSFSGERLMDASDLKEKEKHASGGNFRGNFGEQRFVRPGGPGGPGEGTFGPCFGGSFIKERLMDASDLKEKEKHANGGNFRGNFGEQRFVRPGGPGGPGEGTFGPGFVNARNFRQHTDRMIA